MSRLEAPRRLILSEWRNTPERMLAYREDMQRVLDQTQVLLQKELDGNARRLERMYNLGFEDGYAAALLAQEKHE